MELKEYLLVLRKWWWLLVACILVASVSSYIGTLQMPRIYTATTTIMIGQALEKANPTNQDLYISQQLARTYAEMVKRRPVLEGAANALGLNFIPASENVTTRQVAGTQLLEISVFDTYPERAQALADEIAQQLILNSPTSGSASLERQAFVEEQLADLEVKIREVDAGIEEEQEKLEASNSARAIQQYQANITALENKRSSYQSTYADLLQTVQGGTNYISIVEPANIPTVPTSPDVPETVLLAAAIGLGLALVGAFLIEFLDDTLKSPEEATRLTKLPLLAAISEIEGEDYPDKLIAAAHPLSPITEAYRVLRTNVQFSSVDKPLRTVMVTSPGPTEGKSITLANLGVVFAQSGLKVAIVDTDLRRPVQHKIFGLSNERGFCDAVLSTDMSVMDCIQPTEVENLFVLSSGSHPPNPAELLGSGRAGDMIMELQNEMDLVLFDSPPALVVTDAAVLGSRVDGVLMVNDLGSTRRNMARQGVEELQRARCNLFGLVLNRMTAHSSGYYHQYYYYYYYRDGEQVDRRHRKQQGLLGWLPRPFRNHGHNGKNGNEHSEV